MILRGDGLGSVSYCGDTDSAQYSIILQEDFYDKFDLLSENLTKIEILFTHWSVAQADSNDEKNCR